MRVRVLPDEASAVALVADRLCEILAAKPDSVLGLATGGTMEPLYAELVTRFRSGHVSFAQAKSFNLDEYVGMGPDHPQSYHHFMQRRFFDHVDFQPGANHLPDGASPDPAQAADAYEASIRDAGGIDLQILGIGRNGHIGFNEPHGSLCSRTRVETLAPSTREANQRFFSEDQTPPRQAVTVGLATIMDARRVILLATGQDKNWAVHAALEGPVSTRTPASVLQTHPDATIVLDRMAASALEFEDRHALA